MAAGAGATDPSERQSVPDRRWPIPDRRMSSSSGKPLDPLRRGTSPGEIRACRARNSGAASYDWADAGARRGQHLQWQSGRHGPPRRGSDAHGTQPGTSDGVRFPHMFGAPRAGREHWRASVLARCTAALRINLDLFVEDDGARLSAAVRVVATYCPGWWIMRKWRIRCAASCCPATCGWWRLWQSESRGLSHRRQGCCRAGARGKARYPA